MKFQKRFIGKASFNLSLKGFSVNMYPDIFVLKHESSIFRSFIHPGPVCGFGSAKPVLHGTNSTEPNLFRHGETTYRVGGLI